jgi:hypothetical protein
MSLKLGNDDVTKVMLGSTEVSAVYKGADQVWTAEEPVVIDPIDNVTEVFSAWPYTGIGGQIKLTTGTDTSKGGMVWFKKRNRSGLHSVADTVRGREYYLMPHLDSGQFGPTTDPNKDVISFDSDGLTIGEEVNAGLNQPGRDDNYVVWSFQQRPGFMDIVTYTGDGAQNREVPHRLGCQPGLIIVKSLGARPWNVWHNSFPEWTGGTTEGTTSGGNATGHLLLNTADEYKNRGHFTYVNDTAFGVNFNRLDNNAVGEEYIAYVFADGALDDSIIKCGTYDGNGSTNGPEIDLGWEPQWLLFKCSSKGEAWTIFDTARGITTGGNDEYLMPNDASQAITQTCIDLTSTGFKLNNSNDFLNGSGEEYIYMAIKAPPPPPPGPWGTEALSGTRDCYYTFSGNEFPTNNFTVETWFKSFGGPNHGAYASLFGAWRDPTNNGWMFGYNMSGQTGSDDLGIMHRLYSDTVVYGNVPGSHTLTEWTHVSFTKVGGTIYIHLNGNMVYSFTAGSYTWGGHSYFYGPGSGIRSPAFGTYSNFRVSDIARYNSSNFTPPTEPFVNDANTLILSHYGSEIKDYSDYSRNTTAQSGLQVTNDSPWTARDTYSKLANKQKAVREAASKIKDKRDDS